MRTESQAYAGYFWPVTNPAGALPGTLTISDGGKVTLEVLGNFNQRLEDINFLGPYPRLIGRIESKGFVTLDHCHYTNKNMTFGAAIGKSSLCATIAYIGIALEADDPALISSLQFSVEALDLWHSISGIKSTYDPTAHKASVAFERPAAIPLWKNSDFTLSLSFGYKGPAFGNVTTASISQNSYFLLRCAQPRALDEFSSIAYKVVNLMSFALDRVVSIRDVHACIPEPPNEAEVLPKDEYAQVFFESIFWDENPPKIDRLSLLFDYNRLAPTAQESIEAWMRLHEELLPAFGLYFSAQTNRHTFITSRFLALAQALEVYHRRTAADARIPDEAFVILRGVLLAATPKEHMEFVSEVTQYWNAPTLRTRLERLLSRFPKHFGDDEARKRLAGEITKVRNYNTHFDEKSKAKDMGGADIWNLCQKMNALFQLCVLSDIGFSSESIDQLVGSSPGMKNKLK